jgi:hypothetical protein
MLDRLMIAQAKTSNNIIQKGLAFLCKQSASCSLRCRVAHHRRLRGGVTGQAGSAIGAIPKGDVTSVNFDSKSNCKTGTSESEKQPNKRPSVAPWRPFWLSVYFEDEAPGIGSGSAVKPGRAECEGPTSTKAMPKSKKGRVSAVWKHGPN